jgi:hypothetical protein
MANVLDRNTDFLTNGTVTSAGLHNLIDDTNIYAGLISTQAEKTTVGTADLMLIADSSSIGSPQAAANRTTVYNLFEDALTGGTYVNANFSENLTYGTATGNRTISTSATITTGTIPTLVSNNATIGTTTGTAGVFTSGTITTGLIPTLTAGTTTGTAGIFTSGTIATLNSTTGTVTNLSTTLAGDFTISQGTGTLGTTAVTAGSYGSVSAIPFITVDAKGRVTNATTGTFSSTPADGSITPAKLNGAQSGSAPIFGARAWCRFNGTTTGTNAPTAGGNVSTVARTGAGVYTITFATAMEDANYCVTLAASYANSVDAIDYVLATSAGTCQIAHAETNVATDTAQFHFAVFR